MIRKLFASLSCLVMLGCGGADQTTSVDNLASEPNLIKGEVLFKERKMLPPGAMLNVMLENVSKIDVTSTLVASMEQVLEGSPPFAFSLVYPQNQIQTDVRYNLRANITLADKLLMTSTETLNPFDELASDIRIVLSSVASSSATIPSFKHDAGLAAVSVDPLASLTNTYWKLMSINDRSVVMAETQVRDAFFQLNEQDQSIKGFTGCNQLMGDFTQKGNGLSFSGMGSTRKACSAGMDTEQQFVRVIENAAFFSIHEHQLTLLDANKKPMAQFKAQYFN